MTVAVDFMRIADVPRGSSYESVFEMLESRIEALEEQLEFEKELRKQNPALQDLYDKYQLTKKLTKADE